VFGGWREGGPALTDMFCYDAVTERWTRRAQMVTPRCYMATAAHREQDLRGGGHDTAAPPPQRAAAIGGVLRRGH